ncbi:MAG: lysophospholipid acyltransferase family protein [Dysgonamonadaceae bacterium]|jgi:KDO2-lipid IV(A) lauroyltransferase|nr:lysophospholipid acyltransferase family protein [Dysgonamonadaceae bacterium]
MKNKEYKMKNGKLKEGKTDNLLYYIIYIVMRGHAILPLRVLYLFSDMLYPVVYYLVRYRRKLVRKNLENAFPSRSSEEIIRLEKDFYRNFCDYWFETIKLLHMSDREIRRRMKFKNIEQVNRMMQSGNSGLMYLGHFGNWEWVPSIALWTDPSITLAQIYRPLRNRVFNRLFLRIRSRFGTFGISKDDTLREIVKMRRDHKKTLIGFMSDQTPSSRNIHYWSYFLNQDAAIFTGVERIAKQTGFYVFYLDIVRVKRGYYEAECILVEEHPAATPEFDITERYIRMMEKTILRNPAFWLWSHNRWKYKRV